MVSIARLVITFFDLSGRVPIIAATFFVECIDPCAMSEQEVQIVDHNEHEALQRCIDNLERSKETCILKVSTSSGKNGFILFQKGEIWNAHFQTWRGKEALFNLLAEQNFQLTVMGVPDKQLKRGITEDNASLIQEWLRQLDGLDHSIAQQTVVEQDALPEASIDKEVRVASSIISIVEREQQHSDMSEALFHDQKNEYVAGKENPNIGWDLQGRQSPHIKGEEKMGQMEEVLSKLKEVEGFQAVGVFSPEGEMVAQWNHSGLKLAEVGALANDVLLKAQKATDIMGIGRGQNLHIEAPKSHVLARCLNESTDFAQSTAGRAHLHVVLVLEKESNIAMGKMRLKSVAEELAPLFR